MSSAHIMSGQSLNLVVEMKCCVHSYQECDEFLPKSLVSMSAMPLHLNDTVIMLSPIPLKKKQFCKYLG